MDIRDQKAIDQFMETCSDAFRKMVEQDGDCVVDIDVMHDIMYFMQTMKDALDEKDEEILTVIDFYRKHCTCRCLDKFGSPKQMAEALLNTNHYERHI
jgi:hypothetical protein